MGKQYALPPLIEAVCQFRFVPQRPWNPTYPGLVYGELRDEFPSSRPASGVEFVLKPSAEGVSQQLSPVEKSVFASEDERTLVQIAPNTLTINKLAPYAGWSAFKPLVQSALDAYVSRIEPMDIARIGLRYINRIAFPDANPQLPKYLNFYPHVSESHTESFSSFIVGIRIPYEKGRDVLKLQVTAADSEHSREATVILDLDYTLEQSGAVAVANAMTWLDAAHHRVEQGFEGCLTEDARRLFEPE